MKPKVAFVIPNFRLGGQVSSILELTKALAARGIEATLVGPARLGNMDAAGIAAYGALPLSRRLHDLIAVRARIHDLAADPRVVLHVVLPAPAFGSVLMTLPFPRSRIVVQYEGPGTRIDAEHVAALRDDPRLIAPRLVLNHERLAHLTHLDGVTHLAAHPAIERALVRSGARRIVTIANLGAPEGPPRAVAPYPRPTVAYIGHAHPVKGVLDLVDAFARTHRDDLELVLALSGDGRDARVHERVQHHALGARVRFAGVVDVPELLSRIDALALPYRTMITTTLYPSLLLEASSARCPVIVADVPELAAAYRPHARGVVRFPPRDVSALAGALGTLTRRADAPLTEPFLALEPEAARVDRLTALYEALVRGRTA